MYICISVPVNPRHLDCAVARCSPQALTTTKRFTWLPSATKFAQHSTSSLHAAFRLLLTSLIAPAIGCHLPCMARNTSTVPSGEAHNAHCVAPKTRADVGMMQCVSKGHGKPPGGKTVGTRRRACPCKEEGQPVHTKTRSLTFTDFEYICTIPTSGNILLCLQSCYHLFRRLHIVMQL